MENEVYIALDFHQWNDWEEEAEESSGYLKVYATFEEAVENHPSSTIVPMVLAPTSPIIQ